MALAKYGDNLDWPKQATIYLHSDKEHTYDVGDNLNLSDDAVSLFRHCLMELEVSVLVNEDGTYQINGLKDGREKYITTYLGIR